MFKMLIVSRFLQQQREQDNIILRQKQLVSQYKELASKYKMQNEDEEQELQILLTEYPKFQPKTIKFFKKIIIRIDSLTTKQKSLLEAVISKAVTSEKNKQELQKLLDSNYNTEKYLKLLDNLDCLEFSQLPKILEFSKSLDKDFILQKPCFL